MLPSILRKMRARRLAAMLVTLLSATGAARSQVDDLPVGSPSVDYVDIETNSTNNSAVFHDHFQDANVWVAWLDAALGTFVSADGLDLFIDNHMSTYCPDMRNAPLCAGNYAEWVRDNKEAKVLYTRLEGNLQRMYMKGLRGGQRQLVGPNDGIPRAHQTGTQNTGGRVKVVYRKWMTGSRTWEAFWLDMANPAEEIPLPGLAFGGAPPQWLGSRYILYQSKVGEVVQITAYDTSTRSSQAITGDSGDKYGPFSWQAPEVGGGLLIMAEALPAGPNKYSEIRVYRPGTAGQPLLGPYATLTAPPEAGAFTCFTSPEPFVYRNHSYISVILSPREGSGESQVWVFSVPETSGGPPYTRHRRVDTSAITAEKLDPEWYVTPYGAFIYYWYFDAADGNRIKLRRTVFDPDLP